jgi:hypothetical protein
VLIEDFIVCFLLDGRSFVFYELYVGRFKVIDDDAVKFSDIIFVRELIFDDGVCECFLH